MGKNLIQNLPGSQGGTEVSLELETKIASSYSPRSIQLPNNLGSGGT